MGFSLALVFASSLVLGAPPAAFAAKHKEAEALLKKGVELRAKGKDAEALELFKKAYAISATSRAMAQIALAEQAIGLWIEAEEHLEKALAQGADPWIKSRAPVLGEALKTIEEHLATLDIAGPEGADLKVNGRDAGTLPLSKPLRVTAGNVELELSREGYVPAQRSFFVAGGATVREVITLAPRTETPTVKAPPVGAVASMSSSSEPPPRASPPASSSSTQAVRTQQEEGGVPVLGLVLGGAAVAGLTVGVVGLVVRESHVKRYNDNSMCLVNGRSREENCGDERSAASTAGTIAVVGFVAGGVAAISAGIVLALSGSSAPEGGGGGGGHGSGGAGGSIAGGAMFTGCGLGPGALGVACGFSL